MDADDLVPEIPRALLQIGDAEDRELLVAVQGHEHRAAVLDDQSTMSSSNAGMAIMGSPLREAREAFEREYLKIQIRRFSGNISRTASFIGMERSALHRKLKALGIGEKREGEE